MGWERRQDSRNCYYVQRRKVGGRAVKVYVGTGEHAQRVAALDAQRRAEREAEWAAARAAKSRLLAAQEPLAQLCDELDVLTKGLLLAQGFYRSYGHWLRRHDVDEHEADRAVPDRRDDQADSEGGGRGS